MARLKVCGRCGQTVPATHQCGTTRNRTPVRAERARRRTAGWHRIRTNVITRDGHQCTHTLPDGTRCPATTDLTVDHLVPLSLGGPDDATNLRTLCRRHNSQRGNRP